MNFGAPNWFWALAVLPVLALLYVGAERRSAAKLRAFAAPRLLPMLAGNVDRFRRALRFGLILLTVALAIAALARPQWGYTYEDVKRHGIDLLFAVDTSRSMLSNDVAPNRLERVKLATQDLLTELRGDRVGLIAFAGRAFLQAPLTIDYSAAVESINDLDTKTIPEGGTNISDAIALATRTFGKSAQGNRALVIFTDGEELSGDAVKEAKNAAENGVRIFTVGVGTPQGSLIPIGGDAGSAFVKDAKGQVVKSKLDEARLREIAQETGGIYLHLENGARTMRELYQEGLGKMQAADFDARLSRRPIERYEWPLGAALGALAASLFLNDRRRKLTPRRLARVPLAAAILLVLAIPAFGAAPGLDAYQQQNYDEALRQFEGVINDHPRNRALAELQFDSGTAAYKLRDYDKALQAFSQALLSSELPLQSKGHYNLGNTLYQRGDAQKSRERKSGDWNSALKQYQEALKLEPQNSEAKENYEFVKRKLDELNKPDQSPTPTPPPQNKKDQQQKNDQQQSKQNSQQDQQNSQNQQQQDRQQNQQQKNDNQQQQKNDQQQSNSQPSPSASASPENSPGQSNKDGASPTPGQSPSGSSPSPSPGSGEQGSSPSPSPGGSPSATPDLNNEKGNGASPSPSTMPSASPSKPKSGEIKDAGQPDNKEQPDDKEAAALAEAEAERKGEMSPQQAAQLLQAMKDEEARVQLDERRAQRPVYNDW